MLHSATDMPEQHSYVFKLNFSFSMTGYSTKAKSLVCPPIYSLLGSEAMVSYLSLEQ